MNIESMKTTIVEAISKYRDFTEKNGQFIYRCIMSKWGDGAHPDIYRSLWEASDTYGEFIDKVERGERLKYASQAYGELCKLYRFDAPVDVDDRHRRIVECDAGSVQIGDLAGTMVMRIPNRAGDGAMPVYVIEKGSSSRFNRDAFEFSTVIEGRFQIYDYDCEKPKPSDHADLDGKYAVYAYCGAVVFEQWD